MSDAFEIPALSIAEAGASLEALLERVVAEGPVKIVRDDGPAVMVIAATDYPGSEGKSLKEWYDANQTPAFAAAVDRFMSMPSEQLGAYAVAAAGSRR